MPSQGTALLLLSRDARTKEQIGVMVGREASSSQLRSAFHPTLHHLRRAPNNSDWVVQR
ncbi:MAG: hypothetical protein KIT87_23095 [Anaerolineae bacterium]|nr:hypothetical protein [Anaerolineae bacterium]